MKKIVKLILKILAALACLLLILFLVIYLIYNEPLPKGNNPIEADILANKMLSTIHFDAYKNTKFIEWSFPKGSHHYKWDKQNGKVKVKWDEYLVNLNLNNPQKSTVFSNEKVLTGEDKEKLVETAIKFFNNDSFWLVAPFKIFDKGTTRKLVDLENGSKGLLVTYSSGGTTPGDSYLWKLNSNGFPMSFKIWASIIPIGGLEATWEDWEVKETKVLLPNRHKIGPFTVAIGEVRAYND
tara:strand:- start:46428 stop:47144 length:717 start_codon:yes stop_codon:yes gene_type:complete